MDPRVIGVISATSLLAACAAVPSLPGGHAGAAVPSVTLTIHHDRKARPPLVRLARAEYAIDGRAVIALTPPSDTAQDVPDDAMWSGPLRSGEHVLEARLQYPMRAADDMVFEVVKQYRFRSASVGSVRIGVEEQIDEGSLQLSMFNRFGVRFVLF